MASTVSTDKLMSTLKVKSYDFDPGVATVVAIDWVDMKDFDAFMASFFRTIGTSNVTFDIAVSASSSGSSPVVVKTHAVGSQPDAVGDQLFLECTAEEIKGVLAAGRYVSARVSVVTDTDEGVVTYIRRPIRLYRGLTADIVS